MNIFKTFKRPPLKERVKSLEEAFEKIKEKSVSDSANDNSRVTTNQIIDEWMNGARNEQ